ncbi:MAG: 4'-phosphopantetheinyl transferase family protein [Prevotella sp.]|nr:4'-phosphopantetheinyl transferase superfamily protein [Prevotella sp.]MCI7090059.1 4'-phosphopantetheinyl transferase superfamily protein [Prevotella sp.]MCI7257034.1 4'-phosphopantetheinyl transferase superfamily protein [Prevotella sp.]MDD5783932.1 4'-phosphopantetheinyl transferase superfamily protein [Prevotella sp.]MDD6862708.1 4'-phosphopantetheinyl transferase superfamily protein [Prevotella sp.]
MKIYIDENINDFDLDEAMTLLSEQRREQVARYKLEGPRRQAVAAYLLLRKALREMYGIHDAPVFEYDANGKPSILGHPEIFFNLSHCRKAVACVVADSPVGIDVEETCRFSDSIARYTLDDEEYESVVKADNPSQAFIRLWTMKEALLKYTGEGLRRDIKTVLRLSPANKVEFLTELHDGYVVSVVNTKSCL